MTGERIYLDYNAGAPLVEAARVAMIAALDAGNPSSVHAEGRAARAIVEAARASVAGLVGAETGNVVFTSGASEAAATVLSPEWRMGRSPLRVGRAYVTASDHACILKGGAMPEAARTLLPVGRDGVLDLDALCMALAGHDAKDGPPLVLTHAANNESGVVQPMRAIADIVRKAGGISVIDAAQAPGRISLDLAETGADFLILSGHKIGGPKGVGAIVSAGGVLWPRPLIGGGGQERGLRAGTENVAAIAGFGAAAGHASAVLADAGCVAGLRDRLEAGILNLSPGATIFGREAPERLPNTVFFAVPGVSTETAQIALDLAGIAVSAGSACSSGKVGPSHVLAAMGYGVRESGLRISMGPATTDAAIARVLEVLARLCEKARRREEAA